MSARQRASFIPLLLAVLLPLLFATARAAEVENLFQVRVAVDNQSIQARNDALDTALREVIVRITGRQEVLETAAAKELLQNPSRFVQQFSYETVTVDRVPGEDDSSTPLDPTGDAVKKEQLMLQASFDGSALERRLRGYGLPVWGRERPRTLVLMAVDPPRGVRSVVGADDALAAAWKEAAVRRGLPIELPAMDSEDRGRIAVMDIWGVFEDQLLSAAERYDPNAVLVASAWQIDNGWAMRASLLRDGEPGQRWEHQGGTPRDVVARMVDTLAESYADEFSISSAQFSLGQGDVEMEIRDVDRLEHYARLLDYISGLSVVKNVAVRRVAADRVFLGVELRSSRDTLEKAIALGRVLEPLRSGEVSIPLGSLEGSAGMDFTQPKPLVYRYSR